MKLILSLLLLFALATVPLPISAFYSADDDVVELTESNFDDLVINDDAVWLVEFFGPWCGPCKALAPEYKKAATTLKGVVNVGSVNVEEDYSLYDRYNGESLPTILIFGADKESPITYHGPRQAGAITDAALAEVGN